MLNNNLIHKPEWTQQELEILYKGIFDFLTIKKIKEKLPNRSFCAVKNKIKRVKYG